MNHVHNLIRCSVFLGCLALGGFVPARAERFAEPSSCEEAGDVHIWVSPLNPKPGAEIKFMAVARDGAISELATIDSEGRRLPLQSRLRNGPPWSLSASAFGLAEGVYRLVAVRDGGVAACRFLAVGNRADREFNAPGLDSGWSPAAEAFYSAWIEALFDAPPEENMSFPSLEPVLRDSSRNFLHNYLGMNEDNTLPATPDCADLPYTLRAYFAWKVGLPVGFRACSRGTAKSPPHCSAATVKTEFARGNSSQSVFRSVSRQLADTVHSGTARSALDDESSDLYPVPLSRETLPPGTVYADPYGHVLVVAQWVPQTARRPGMLLAVDAQPDNSVTRKRFWEGTFLFAEVASAGPGFKAFRPIVRSGSGAWRMLSNGALTDNPSYTPFSLEQEQLSPDGFYARIGKLANPGGLEPIQAYESTLDALVEQLDTRVTSVANGEAYFRKNPGAVIAMPSGSAIFETIGPWEDYSTPSRDMRLIIAINVLNDLPDKIVRHPALFVLTGLSPLEAKAQVERYHARRIRERTIRYSRSDGSLWELSVADLLERKPVFEMAYNPNDCAEMRWGARPGTEEYATCRRHAPAAQHAKMEPYRVWFREARRPTR